MKLAIQKYEDAYLLETMNIWNEVIEGGIAFPQLDFLDVKITPPDFYYRYSIRILS